MNDVICAYPWNASAIRPDGQMIPCCRYSSNYTDHELAMVTSEDLRNSMLENKPIEYCEGCYKEESSGIRSMRQESLRWYIPIKNEILPIRQLEVSFSNLCNLACVHCSRYFSTKWYSEDVKAGRVEKEKIKDSSFNFKNWDLSQLKGLKIIGGEPLMEQERFIEFLKSIDLSKLSLQICTNGTQLPNPELGQLIEKCKNVALDVSLDGLHTINDWYRWPSKFSEVLHNMKEYEKQWGEFSNIRKRVHHVVNAVNIMYLEDFYNFMKTEFPLWEIEYDWIRWPEWQQLSVLPDATKISLIEKFKALDSEYSDDLKLRPNPFKVSVDRLSDTPTAHWNEFKENVFSISSERNLDFLSMVPKLKDLLEL
jgi:sulfatase maturation enzyme AslB (radical SAM superfamily)